eukprot:TRINITY_DN62667_c0_g1_i1.p1 TRINITY_DN62667_c0_g1~~TRINITY_DN62667_c0_g1_i1.p1  ORF type:complete len:314 (+),score=35.23 TRINITY_DN62667_c0_g1_i1:110-943(+)
MVAGGASEPVRRRLRTKVTLPKGSAFACASKRTQSLFGDASVSTCSVDTDCHQAENPLVAVKERNADYIIVEALSPAVRARLTKFLSKKKPVAANMKNEGGESDDERKPRYDDRDSSVAWFDAKSQCPFLHDRLVEILEVANSCWPILKTDLQGKPVWEAEKTQYAIYKTNQHFQAWHQDAFENGGDMEDARQVSVVIMLSDKKDYTGGVFQAKIKRPGETTRRIKNIALQAGDAIVFPAKRLLHRVTKVKSGIRKTLVAWANDRESCKFYNKALQD